MKPILPFLLILFGCLPHSFAGAGKPAPPESPSFSLIFRLKAGASLSEVTALFKKNEILSHKKLSTSMEIYRLVISLPNQSPVQSDTQIQKALRRIEKSGLVEYVERDSTIHLDKKE